MALVPKKIIFNGGFDVDMAAFYADHPLLTLDDVVIHEIDESQNIYLTYDDTKEQ